MSNQSNRYKEKFLKSKIELDFKLHWLYNEVAIKTLENKKDLNYLSIMNTLDQELKSHNLY